MIDVSPTYLNEIYDDETMTRCSVIYGAFDVTAKSLATATANSSQTFAPPSQTINAINNFNKYTDLELNNWVLDGKTNIFPNNPASTEWGWWTGSMSNANGTFATTPELTYTWNEPHSSVGLTISANNGIKRMRVFWYNELNSVMATENYTNDDIYKTVHVIDKAVANYYKIQIEFIEIIPYHYVKVQDTMFGREYTWQDEIIELDVQEMLDEKMQRLESKQVTIKLGNIDNAYNKYNPDNRLKYFQEGQLLQVYNTALLSNGKEQVSLGQFYLTSWGSPTEYTVEFKGNDLLYKLNDMYYYSKMYNNATVQTIVDDLLSTYTDTIVYNIADNIKNVTLTGYIPIISYREALQHIAFAAGGVCYVDRYGVLQLKRISNATPVDTIGYSKKAPSQDTQGELYNSVTVSMYTYNLGESQELFKGTVSGTQILTFSSPATNISISGTYTSYVAYVNCLVITGASGEITISGQPYNTSEQPITVYLTQDTRPRYNQKEYASKFGIFNRYKNHSHECCNVAFIMLTGEHNKRV